jgi:hypothetical protein
MLDNLLPIPNAEYPAFIQLISFKASCVFCLIMITTPAPRRAILDIIYSKIYQFYHLSFIIVIVLIIFIIIHLSSYFSWHPASRTFTLSADRDSGWQANRAKRG